MILTRKEFITYLIKNKKLKDWCLNHFCSECPLQLKFKENNFKKGRKTSICTYRYSEILKKEYLNELINVKEIKENERKN